MKSEKIKRILIYRLGSLGDTIVALPCFYLIKMHFPDTERYVLTNFPVAKKAPHMQAILSGTGLVHGYFDYPLKTRNLKKITDLFLKIREWKPDILIYMVEPRGKFSILRDFLFFKTCGISRIMGLPFSVSLLNNRFDVESGFYEHESVRLVRCLLSSEDVKLDDKSKWDLQLTFKEEKKALNSISTLQGSNYFFTCCAGTKMTSKDWGQENWERLLLKLSLQYQNFGIAFIGSIDERQRCNELKKVWNGPAVNLCGKLSPRESAVVIRESTIFLGHDSGPMHLASAVDTPCVAIFSSRKNPAIWFPFGYQKRHRVIYHKVDCAGCNLEDCIINKKKCIMSITVDEVLQNIELLRNELSLF